MVFLLNNVIYILGSHNLHGGRVLGLLEILAEAGNTANNTSVNPTIDIVTLAALALGACLVCLYFVFNWVRKLQLQSHLRTTLVQGAARIRRDALNNQLEEDAWMAPLDSDNNPFPEEAEKIGLKHSIWLMTPEVQIGYLRLPEPFIPQPCPEEIRNDPEELKKWQEAEKKRREEWEKMNARVESGISAFKEWAADEQDIYNARMEENSRKALEKAEGDVPKTMDVSILGTGFSFILEFSTVIVIIFAVVVLGILGILEGKEISTILAAIAGYVLGKVSGWAPNGGRNQQQPQEKKPEK